MVVSMSGSDFLGLGGWFRYLGQSSCRTLIAMVVMLNLLTGFYWMGTAAGGNPARDAVHRPAEPPVVVLAPGGTKFQVPLNEIARKVAEIRKARGE